MGYGLMVTSEGVAYWFFRLNGCLTITNFIVHPDLVRSDNQRGQLTEIDILAVRFPYRCELFTSSNPMRDHEVFNQNSKIDFVIAEVKRSGLCRLNGPWIRQADENLNRLLYAIGTFPPDRVPDVANALYWEGGYEGEQFHVRLFAIAERKPNNQLPERVVQLSWQDVLTFIYNRFREYQRHKAQNDRWDSLGRWLYHRAQGLSEFQFIDEVLALM